MTIPAPPEMLCLDFVNTLFWRGSDPQTESLADATSFADWLKREGGLPADRAGQVAGWVRDNPPEGIKLLGQAIDLRETIHRLLVARISGKPMQETDLQKFNAALAAAPVRENLVQDEKGMGWQVKRGRITAPSVLVPVLWSAADLLLRGDVSRLRQCANKKCQWVFFDTSRSGARRWCTMNSCGNRAKAHRHYHRTKTKD